MSILRMVAVSGGGDVTQWVALVGVSGALVGPLLGVWLGKRLERAAQRDAHQHAELLEQTRALKEALTQVELLLPNIDPVFVLRKISAGLPLPDIAAADETKSLYEQQERVELLLVRASMLSVSQEVQTLLEELRISTRDGTLASVALLAQIARSARAGEGVVPKGLPSQQTVRIRQLANALRENLNITLPQRLPEPPAWTKLEIIMDDAHLIEAPDVLSGLPDRPNLMDLPPAEFESVIANLFTKMGFATALTASGADPGVDILAIDRDPLSGGKVVIEVKRYRHVVPVAAVRDLFGAMVHERAARAILVTTSDFGPGSHKFAAGKPIQLLSGSNLLYLLERYAGIQARIK